MPGSGWRRCASRPTVCWTELNEAEADWQELVIAQQRVGRVLAGQHDAEGERQAVPDAAAPPADNATVTSAVEPARAGTIVPRWSAGADPGALAAAWGNFTLSCWSWR